MEKAQITIVLPVYNEELRLESAVKEIQDSLARAGISYNIIISEDGSTDESSGISGVLSAKDKRIMHLHSNKRLGRGTSLCQAIQKSHSPIILYMDIDLSTDLKHIPALIASIMKGAAIATGSRLLPGSSVSRSLSRDLFSKSYNLFVRLLTCSKIHDHQCGFKAFDRKKVLQLLDHVKDNHWFWDTEMLVLAQRNGLKVSEIPIVWTGRDRSKVAFISDSLDMGIKLIRLSLRS